MKTRTREIKFTSEDAAKYSKYNNFNPKTFSVEGFYKKASIKVKRRNKG